VRLYAQVLRDPTNSQLNLRYAELAEASGKLRWALAAYERVLVNDPENVEAQAGLQRVRRRLQPNSTQFVAELGAIGESNPRYLPSGARAEAQGLATLSMRDERTIADVRWRTTAAAFGLLHSNEQDLNYGYVGAATGPVLDVGPGLVLHPALGGAATYFDGRFYYGEAAAMATFEDTSGPLPFRAFPRRLSGLRFLLPLPARILRRRGRQALGPPHGERSLDRVAVGALERHQRERRAHAPADRCEPWQLPGGWQQIRALSSCVRMAFPRRQL